MVIAYGHKIPPAITEAAFSINLHASLLPRWRGASPINRAIIAGDRRTGVSVIALAERMDAGVVYATRAVDVDPAETAGELHDRLALLGPEVVEAVLQDHAAGTATGAVQDESAVTLAPKLSKADGTVDFDRPADEVRARIHGLEPWPGCTVSTGDGTMKIRRAVAPAEPAEPIAGAAPGTLTADGCVRCADGWIRILTVQVPGGRPLSWEDHRRGHAPAAGTRLRPNN